MRHLKYPIVVVALLASFAAAAQPDDGALTKPERIAPRDCGPFYPRTSLLQNEQGVVELAFTVTEAGAVKDVTVTQSSGYGRLDKAAIRCAESWTYHPATKDGLPVAVTWRTEVDWGFITVGGNGPDSIGQTSRGGNRP